MLPWDREPEVEMVSKAEFKAGRKRRFGAHNPELMEVPFWKMMVRLGWSAYDLHRHYGSAGLLRTPPWIFSRYGMTTTVLNDRILISIGGVYEDFYDPDFMIYNDVVVRDTEGGVWIYGYPEKDFPPRDFHTATLLSRPETPWNSILIIGGAGYAQDRMSFQTPVFGLDLDTMRIHELKCQGDDPGLIYKHSAALLGADRLLVSGGRRLLEDGEVVDNGQSFILNLNTMRWTLFEERLADDAKSG